MKVKYDLLNGAYDLHLHCSPDILPRSVDVFELAEEATKHSMAGVGIKNHCVSTADLAYVLNKVHPNGPAFISSIALNPPVGGINPYAVEAALKAGVDIVYFPTYSAKHHIERMGAGGFASPMPMPCKNFKGLEVIQDNALRDVVIKIIKLIVKYDAVLATGHISPRESLMVLHEAKKQGVKKMIVTHASEMVPEMRIEDQKEAVSLGAFIEHSFLALELDSLPKLTLKDMVSQIRTIGIDNVILTSDFGKANLESPVKGFLNYLELLLDEGFTIDEIQTMVKKNPKSLLEK